MFFWGAATSAHQVEGENKNDWSEWEKKNAAQLAEKAKQNPPKGGWPVYISVGIASPLNPENYISGAACDHYNRYEEDFEMAKSLGHNAHRFSIEWSRIEPEQGKFDEQEIEHYRNVVKALRARGIEPFVTLWHWPLPLWAARMGGWKKRRMAKYFARYAEHIIRALRNEVTYWITLNEPEIYAKNSYLTGKCPPQKHSILAYFKTLRNLARGHRYAYRIIKKTNQNAMVGIAKNNIYFDASPKNIIDRTLKSIADRWWNRHFLDKIKDTQDFIGLNFYFRNRIHYGFGKEENRTVSDTGWELYPEGIYHVLKDLARYRLPIIVTENGIADARDAHRAQFIKETIGHLLRAKKEGVDVRGYLHWALLDNFEWAKGFWPRFGLIEMNYRTMERRIRKSAHEYARLIAELKDI